MAFRITASFAAKAAAAVGLVMLGDSLFWTGGGFGSNLGVFALIWTAVTLLLSRASQRDPRSRGAAGAALLFAALLADSPGLLGFALFWSALAMVALLPRVSHFDHAGRWALRLALHGLTTITGPWRDLVRLRRHVGGQSRARRLLPLLPLPLIGGTIFLSLFASANPVIGDALLRVRGPDLNVGGILRSIFWILLFTVVWAAFRPRRIRIGMARVAADPVLEIPGISVGSVTLALLTFNLLFALQNGLDLVYLWSGAPLPEGVTLAEYAHRGAYPLIVTALLAGLFVLVALQPASATAAVPAIRGMVVLWIAQNVFLVVSTMLRTVDYIEAYSLTQLRIAALIWMALVAIGLVLIVWRMMQRKSVAWLINANAAAALLVLAGCSAIDLGSVAASWNVRHAREAGGNGAALDLCYLNQLGPSSLVSLVRLEQRGGFTSDFTAGLRSVRHEVMTETLARQAGGGWTWRNVRRLAEVETMLGDATLPGADPVSFGRACDGSPLPPPYAPEAPGSPTLDVATPITVAPAPPPVPEAALTNRVER